MNFTIDPLLDKDFLRQLDLQNNKKISCKIITLTWDEHPIAEIQGQIVSGSINVDGSSAVRRTCNLTLIEDPAISALDAQQITWTLNTKFKVYIGVENDITDIYDKTIWFPQGIFIITEFSSSYKGNELTITIQGRDKMCLLNGDVGGALFAAHDFGKTKVLHENGIEEYEYTPIRDIIKNAVHEYALEPYENIIINDVDSCAVQLMSYTAKNTPMFVYSINGVSNIVFGTNTALGAFLSAIYDSNEYVPGMTIGSSDTAQIDDVSMDNPLGQDFIFIKGISYGDTAGYQLTELTYAGDLTVAVGDSVASAFNKIIEQLGDYEYFYDLDGRFIFQRKPIYCNVSWSNVVYTDDSYYVDSIANSSASTYTFQDGQLLESISNKPSILKIRNDFSIWGTVSTAATDAMPVHLRCAIDDKPKYYISPRGVIYKAIDAVLNSEDKATITAAGFDVNNTTDWKVYDWRELIYQMAYDYSISQSKIKTLAAALEAKITSSDGDTTTSLYYNKIDKSLISASDTTVLASNLSPDIQYYYTGTAEGNTINYTRQHRDTTKTSVPVYPYYIYKDDHFVTIYPEEYESYKISDYDIFILTSKFDTKLKSEMDAWQSTWNTGYDAYYADMLEFWRQLYIPENIEIKQYIDDNWETVPYMDNAEFAKWTANGCWNPYYFSYSNGQVLFVHPELLIFWFDFLDTDSALEKYKVSRIGRRPYAVTDSDVKALLYLETPSLLFTNATFEQEIKDNGFVGYTRVNLPTNIWNYFVISSQGKSAKEALDTIVYQSTYFNEEITLSTIPIFYLQPNTRISVYNKELNLNSDYIIKTLSIQLSHDGMMSISATRVETNIL